MNAMQLRYLIAGVLFLVPILLQAQAPRTISYQGLLTDTGGLPVSDGTRTVLFGLHLTKSTPGSVWTETQSVATVNGIFNVELGSVTPIDIPLDRELWLSIKVESDPEISPRTRLTSVPTALALATPVRDTIRIATALLGTDGSELRNEGLTIHANDAMIGLYSDPAGVAGSGLQLGEIESGSLTNKWTMYRGTTPTDGSLLFSFGQASSYGANKTVVEFDTSGVVAATAVTIEGEYRYDSEKTRYLQLPAAAFRLANEHDADTWRELNGYISCWSDSCTETFKFTAPIDLPDSAEVKSFTVYYYDNSNHYDLSVDFTVKRRGLLSSSTQGLGSSPATTANTSTSVQSSTINTTSSLYRFIDETSYMYWAEVEVDYLGDAFGAPSGLRRFYGMTIEYEVDKVE